eukprot:3938596-Rhodomonas_salina.1
MECVTPTRKRKWVIDLDGALATLHSAGLVKNLNQCTFDEMLRFEDLALRYGAVVLKCLREIGFIDAANVHLTILRRHRVDDDTSGGGDGDGKHFSKLSLHLTLGVAALQDEWSCAMNAVDKRLKGKCEWLEREKDALLVGKVDDGAIKNNKIGQNMSIVFASKPVEPWKLPQPLFQFAGTYQVSVDTLETVRLNLECLENDLAKYWFSSMLIFDPLCCVRSDAWVQRMHEEHKLGVQKKRKRGDGGHCSEEQSPMSVTSAMGKIPMTPFLLPDFVRDLLVSHETTFNTTMQSLGRQRPSVVTLSMVERGEAVFVQLTRPALCVAYLTQGVPCLYKHRANGCVVCVYTNPDYSAKDDEERKLKPWKHGKTRVFVFCYGCKEDGRGKAPAQCMRRTPCSVIHPPAWPWYEIFPYDAQIAYDLRSVKQSE